MSHRRSPYPPTSDSHTCSYTYVPRNRTPYNYDIILVPPTTTHAPPNSIDHCSGEAGHTAAVYNSEYEPVNQDVVDTNERNDTDSLESNTAYGKLDIQTELQPFEGQNTLELKGNASYNSVSASPVFDDVEYSYPATNFAHVKVGAQTELHPLEGYDTLELKGNASYNSVSASPVFDDVEYSYPATNFAPVKIN